jgi:hypothetical protein
MDHDSKLFFMFILLWLLALDVFKWLAGFTAALLFLLHDVFTTHLRR